jgi:hypothetical protein
MSCDDSAAAEPVRIFVHRLTGVEFAAEHTCMPTTQFHRFLAPRPRRGGSSRAALGRNFVVVRETWRIIDDPAVVRPSEQVLSTGRSAAEAADVGRKFAICFSRHGFHKASRRWWATDGAHFHRYSVRPATRGWAALLQAIGLRRVPRIDRPEWIMALREPWSAASQGAAGLADASA